MSDSYVMAVEREGRAIVAADESERLAALRAYGLLDRSPDPVLDRITGLAARLFGVPVSLITLVDLDRVWFKSRHGLPQLQQVDREPGLCVSAIEQDGPWVITDARLDPRAAGNTLVRGDLGVRFYAGVPLITPDGHRIGNLCVLDTKPRRPTADELVALADLAGVVMDELGLR